MHNTQRGQTSSVVGEETQTHSFVIQIRTSITTEESSSSSSSQTPSNNFKFNFSAMKLFHRFRKVLMRLVFSVPSRRSSTTTHDSTSSSCRYRNSDRFEPPKTSCSSYYSSYSHYNEAISDCIEFFNKSAQEGGNGFDARNSDVVV